MTIDAPRSDEGRRPVGAAGRAKSRRLETGARGPPAGPTAVDRVPRDEGGRAMHTTEANRRSSAAVLAAWAAIAGGLMMLVLGIPLAPLQAGSEVPAPILALNAVSHALLIAGIVGVARSGAAGEGILARSGLALALLGLVALTLAEIVAMADPESAEMFYATATLTMMVGLIAAGVAVLLAGRWGGWQRFAPLACGLFIPLVLTPAFALPGYAAHYAIGLWGGCWLLLGLALRGPAVTRKDVSWAGTPS